MGYAVVAVSFSMLHDLDGVLPIPAAGHMDGDCWVEPERRYNMAALRDALCLPAWWQPPTEVAGPVVFIDAWRRLLCFWLSSDSFPETPEGQYPPYVYPVLRDEWDEDLGRYRTVFDHLDMHEVENAANIPTSDCVDTISPGKTLLDLVPRTVAPGDTSFAEYPVQVGGPVFTDAAIVDLRALIREEIEAHERKQMDRARRVRQPGEND